MLSAVAPLRAGTGSGPPQRAKSSCRAKAPRMTSPNTSDVSNNIRVLTVAPWYLAPGHLAPGIERTYRPDPPP